MYKHFRKQIISSFGASKIEVEELYNYNKNIFNHNIVTYPLKLPLTDEAHIERWEEYLRYAKDKGIFSVLKEMLIEFQFPVSKGISRSDSYQTAKKKGIIFCNKSTKSLVLNQPDNLNLIIHQSLAGKIPVIIIENREDFVTVIQAIVKKNEPVFIPKSMGACMIAGYNNWDRIRQIRKSWEKKNPFNSSEAQWQKEFKKIIPQKELYQDRFILLSNGPYSAVSARNIGLSVEDWKRKSLVIRLEHECTHYFTRRIFSSMRNNLYDELIADFMGILSAIGEYRADWFLRFMGLENFPEYREGERLQNYRGDPPLSNTGFKILQSMVKNAAENLETFTKNHSNILNTNQGRALALVVLTYMTMEELASNEAVKILKKYWNKLSTEVIVQSMGLIFFNG